jgi:hypothetical protein
VNDKILELNKLDHRFDHLLHILLVQLSKQKIKDRILSQKNKLTLNRLVTG